MRKITFLILLLALTLTACEGVNGLAFFASSTLTVTLTATETLTPSATVTPSPTLTPSPSITPSPTITTKSTSTLTPSETPTPTITLTPTISPTPTVDLPDAIVSEANAHCRYAPGTAYLHAADLFAGDHGLVWNRNYAGTWLWVRFDKLNYACWVAASVLEVDGDIFGVPTYSFTLPKTTLYGPVSRVVAIRSGNQVVVTWDEVWMTEDDARGYLIEAKICQNGYLIDMAVHTDGTSYTFVDETTCSGESKGRLYAVEKHGYTDPVPIPWP